MAYFGSELPPHNAIEINGARKGVFVLDVSTVDLEC